MRVAGSIWRARRLSIIMIPPLLVRQITAPVPMAWVTPTPRRVSSHVTARGRSAGRDNADALSEAYGGLHWRSRGHPVDDGRARVGPITRRPLSTRDHLEADLILNRDVVAEEEHGCHGRGPLRYLCRVVARHETSVKLAPLSR